MSADGRSVTRAYAEDSEGRSGLDQAEATPWGATPCSRALLEQLLDPTGGPDLPDWSYRRWCYALHYPDLAERAHRTTRELGSQRDAVLCDPAVRVVVEWAGRRRPTHPVAGAAAALVVLSDMRAHLMGDVRSRIGPNDLARRLVTAVDRAQPLPMTQARRDAVLFDPERLADVLPEPAVAEHPRLPGAVERLLGLAGADGDRSLQRRVEGAVVQAGDWWARHARTVPADITGPDLPGITPAQELRATERLAAAVTDAELLGLVAGPRPGRGRPCQVAWRRGLTYWVAVDLASGGSGPSPTSSTLRWWRSALSDLPTPRSVVAVGVKMLLHPA